jgi:Cyclic nucleotide-binding domain
MRCVECRVAQQPTRPHVVSLVLRHAIHSVYCICWLGTTDNKLRESATFVELGEFDINALLGLMRKREMPDGLVFGKIGEPTNCMYLILDGTTKTRTGLGRETLCNRGTIIGDYSMVNDIPRTLELTSIKKCVLLRLMKKDYDELASIQKSKITASKNPTIANCQLFKNLDPANQNLLAEQLCTTHSFAAGTHSFTAIYKMFADVFGTGFNSCHYPCALNNLSRREAV